MISAAGGYEALRDGFTSVGGKNISPGCYWTSTNFHPDDAYYIFFKDGTMEVGLTNSSFNNRACVAF